MELRILFPIPPIPPPPSAPSETGNKNLQHSNEDEGNFRLLTYPPLYLVALASYV